MLISDRQPSNHDEELSQEEELPTNIIKKSPKDISLKSEKTPSENGSEGYQKKKELGKDNFVLPKQSSEKDIDDRPNNFDEREKVSSIQEDSV